MEPRKTVHRASASLDLTTFAVGVSERYDVPWSRDSVTKTRRARVGYGENEANYIRADEISNLQERLSSRELGQLSLNQRDRPAPSTNDIKAQCSKGDLLGGVRVVTHTR